MFQNSIKSQIYTCKARGSPYGKFITNHLDDSKHYNITSYMLVESHVTRLGFSYSSIALCQTGCYWIQRFNYTFCIYAVSRLEDVVFWKKKFLLKYFFFFCFLFKSLSLKIQWCKAQSKEDCSNLKWRWLSSTTVAVIDVI